MKTRRAPQPYVPDPPSLRTIASIIAITLFCVLYIVSLTATNTFDAVMVSQTGATRLNSIRQQAQDVFGISHSANTTMPHAFVSVSHPLITVTIGTLLMAVPDRIFPLVVIFLSVILFLVSIGLFIHAYPDNKKYLPFIAYVVANIALYEELKNPALQLFRILLSALLVYNLERNGKQKTIAVIIFALCILEPINAIIPFFLFFGRYRKASYLGLAAWVCITLACTMLPIGKSYLGTLQNAFFSFWIPSSFSIAAVGRFIPLSPYILLMITGGAIGGLIFLSKSVSYALSSSIAMIVVVIISGTSVPSSFLLPPILTAFLIAMKEIRLTPFLASALCMAIIPSPIFWLRIGTTQQIISGHEIALAALWYVYWGIICIIAIISSHRHTPDTIRTS